jgi:hypothetical protein
MIKRELSSPKLLGPTQISAAHSATELLQLSIPAQAIHCFDLQDQRAVVQLFFSGLGKCEEHIADLFVQR